MIIFSSLHRFRMWFRSIGWRLMQKGTWEGRSTSSSRTCHSVVLLSRASSSTIVDGYLLPVVFFSCRSYSFTKFLTALVVLVICEHKRLAMAWPSGKKYRKIFVIKGMYGLWEKQKFAGFQSQICFNISNNARKTGAGETSEIVQTDTQSLTQPYLEDVIYKHNHHFSLLSLVRLTPVLCWRHHCKNHSRARATSIN